MAALRPEILKQEIKVFFVKYNDPIYVKLEKLDIMIRLASQANIAQVLPHTASETRPASSSFTGVPPVGVGVGVGPSLAPTRTLGADRRFCATQVLAELKEYATEVDVDFVRKAVRAIGRCAIKVEVKKRNIHQTMTVDELLFPSADSFSSSSSSSNRPSAVSAPCWT